MNRNTIDKSRSIQDSDEDIEGNVDKIRQILFGGQMRDYEQRFELMEKRLTQNIERVAGNLESRLDRFDAYARRRIDKLSEQLKTEKIARTAENKKGIGELKNLINQVETWFAEVDEQLAKDAKDIRTEQIDQTEQLKVQIRKNQEQITTALQEKAEGLVDKTIAREDMASLLAEMAVRIGKDFKSSKD